jgi:protein-S-isoprenylcysteine O-methyltransferase Ste14
MFENILKSILTLSRHILAILLMPFIVVIVFPAWLLNIFASVDTRWGTGLLLGRLSQSAGITLGLLGLMLFVWCVSLFARVGRGTLAPWDETQNLVSIGPYRYVRNPMISGVALMLVGQALFWGSWVLCFWVCLFIVINHLYFVLSEEPGLERRFKEPYRVYRANVPRWIPRLRSWQGKSRSMPHRSVIHKK